MDEKSNYQYFSNISQRMNLLKDTKSNSKSNSNQNLKNVSNDNQSWFSSLTKKDKSNERTKRQNSCTSSSGAGSLNLSNFDCSSLNKSSSNSISNSLDSKFNDDEKADTISNLNKLDAVRTESNTLAAVALRNSTKSNRSSNKTVQKKDEVRNQSKDDSESAYYRYSSPEPFDLVPNQLFIQQYLEYLRLNNLELNFDQLNYLTQLNQLNQLNQQNNQPNNNQANIQLSSLVTKQSSASSNTNPTVNVNSVATTTINSIEESRIESKIETGIEQTTTKTEQSNNIKPQSVQCPQLAINKNLTNSEIQLNSFDKLNQQQFTETQQPINLELTNKTNSEKFSKQINQLICDEFKNLQLTSESDNNKEEEEEEEEEEQFKLVKELFDSEAHLYMSNQQMAALEALIRDNPRTCTILLTSTNQELGFNLITKKKPRYAHIVKKVNPNLVSAKAGLQENDQLLMVNGTDCRKLTHNEVVKLLNQKEHKLKLVVCQPDVYQWYLSQDYELNLDYEEQENEQNNGQENGRKMIEKRNDLRAKNMTEHHLGYEPPTEYNERCVDDARPIQVSDQIIPYVENTHKDNQINSPSSPTKAIDDPFSSRNSFKRSYKLKKKPTTTHQSFTTDDVVDDSLSMSTSVSPFDEKYGELRDEIFNSNQSSKTAKNKSNLNSKTQRTSLSNKNLSDSYNYESKKLEYNEFMDSSSHKLEKSETTVEISNDEFQNKKVTRKSVEKLHKYEDQPMKNIGQSTDKNKLGEKSNEKLTTTRAPYTPVYGKTSLFSNSLFDKSKTTTSGAFDKSSKDKPTSIFDRPTSLLDKQSPIFDKPTSIFDRQTSLFDKPSSSLFDRLNTSDKLKSENKTSYTSPNYSSTTYNQSLYSNQSYKNESSYSTSKSYLSPTSQTKYSRPCDSNQQQTSVKEPYIERHVIEPKEAKLVHICDDDDEKPSKKETKPLKVQKQLPKQQPKETTKPLKTVQANSINDLPSPRLCTLRLPKDRIVSFGFTIKTSRKTNAKIIVDIVRNSIAHRAGLRVNDIIVEVNENFVGMDSHQQVTDRIKAHSEDEVRLLVVTEAEMDIYRIHGLVPTSEQSNVIFVEYDSELMMPMHSNEIEDTDCLRGCGSFLDNLTAKQYRTYLQSSKKRPEPANSPLEFQEKIKKFEKL